MSTENYDQNALAAIRETVAKIEKAVAAGETPPADVRVPCAGKFCTKKLVVDFYRLKSAVDTDFEPFATDWKPLCTFCEEHDGRSAALSGWESSCPAIFRQPGPLKTDVAKLPPAWATIKRWTVAEGLDGRRSLYIAGATGTCKSRMLFLLLWHRVLTERVRFKVLRGGEFRKTLLSLYDGKFSAVSDWVDELAAVPVLAFDDFGQDVLSEAMLADMWRLLDARFCENLPTIFLSNFAPTELPARWGKRGKAEAVYTIETMARRICDYARPVVVAF